MKKSILPALLLFGVLSAAAQNPDSLKQPKIRYTAGVFSSRYEIGDKDATQKAVIVHMGKTSTDGYFHLTRAKNMQQSALGWSIFGLGGSLVGLLAKKPETKAIGWGAAAVGWGISLGLEIGSQAKIKRGVDAYNRKHGYGI